MKLDPKQAAKSLKGNALWMSLDVAQSVWRHRGRLRDPEMRADASTDVAWDAGESVIKSAASAGGASAAGLALAAVAEGGTILGTAIAGSAAVSFAAPAAAAAAAAFAAGKIVTVIRTRVGQNDGSQPLRPSQGDIGESA